MKYSSLTTNKKGFTLVETLVAIGILVLAITGAFTAAQSGLFSYEYTKNQTIAIFLAQEAVEYVHAVRDSNAMVGNYWLQGLAQTQTDPCRLGGVCSLDVQNPANNAYCGSSFGLCQNIKQDATTGYYGYNSSYGTTNFKREIQITGVYGPDCPATNCTEVSLVVRVSWSKGIVSRTFTIKEHIFSWQ